MLQPFSNGGGGNQSESLTCWKKAQSASTVRRCTLWAGSRRSLQTKNPIKGHKVIVIEAEGVGGCYPDSWSLRWNRGRWCKRRSRPRAAVPWPHRNWGIPLRFLNRNHKHGCQTFAGPQTSSGLCLLTHLWWLEGFFLQLLLQLCQRGVGDQLLKERRRRRENISSPSVSCNHSNTIKKNHVPWKAEWKPSTLCPEAWTQRDWWIKKEINKKNLKHQKESFTLEKHTLSPL